MKKRILTLALAVILIFPCVFMLTGCGKEIPTYPNRVTNVEADDVTNYWIEYNMNYSHHKLYSIAKATKDNVTYYYMDFENNGNYNEMFVIRTGEHYVAYAWDNSVGQKKWYKRDYDEYHPEKGEGDSWYDFKTSFLSDYFSMALVNLQYTGEVDSATRYDSGDIVKDEGVTPWTTAGYPSYGEKTVLPETIEGCLHFYDEKYDTEYYFAPETHFLLCMTNDMVNGRTTSVYKRHFTMKDVFVAHEYNATGLPLSMDDLESISV